MPVVEDVRAGRRRRRLGAAAIAAIFVVTQAAAVALAAPPGTSLTATKTTAGHLVQTFPWTLSKEVAPSSLTLSSGDSDSVTYTVGATKGNAVQSAYFDGEICVTNTGAVPTQGLAITDAITKPPSKTVLASAPVSVDARPVLQPGEAFCYPYRVELFSAITPGDTYKDTVSVTISNKSGKGSGPSPSATAALPTTVEASNNDSITVDDTNGSSFTFSATGTETYSKTFTCPADAGSHTNTLSATAFVSTPSVSEPAPASATVDVTCLEPDVTVSKDDGQGSATLGDTITYAMSVSNIGLGVAHAVTLSDSLPAGITWSIDNTTDFALSGSSLTLKNQPIDLAAGATLTVNVSGTVTQNVCETTLTNSASVLATNEDAGNIGNNTATDTTSIGCVQLEVSKTADAASVSAGDAVGYTIAVSNSGAGSASGVTMTDALPADAGLSWTISPPVADCSILTGTLTCNFGTIAAAGSASVHITGPTSPETCGTISNEASATTTSAPGTADSGPAIIVVNCPDVAVTKAANASPISAGDTAGYTIVVSNVGAGIARSVTLSDPLPAGVSWSDDSAACVITSGTLSCAFGDLNPGEDRTVHVTGATDAAACGTISNTATAAATNEASTDQGNNSSTADITVGCPDVTTSKVPDAGTIDGGDEAGYTITVTNVGAATANGVTLSDPLPTNGGLAWAIDVPGSDSGCTVSAGTVSCAFGSLAPAESKHVRITSPTTFDTCGTIDNTATAAATNEAAADQVNNASSAQIAVNCVDIEIAKLADDDTVDAGDPIGFLITVTNVGSGTATDVLVADTLPTNAGLDWAIDVPGSDSGCTISTGQLSCSFGDIGSGASKHVHITSPTAAAICAVADASALVDNTVSVSLTNGPGDQASASITVACPNDPPVNTVPGAQTVDEDTDLVFSVANSNAISISDPDAGAGNVQVTVTVLNGTITPASGSGATVVGSGTSSATITGTIAQVNAALSGIKYRGNLNFNDTRGSETLTITTDDQGNTGAGGPLTDTDTVDITVDAVNDAPVAAAKAFTVQANMQIDGLSGLLTGATDPDTGDGGYTASFMVNDVVLDACTGGTISNVNTAAGTFDFDPPPGSLGPCTLKFRVDDSGNPAPAETSAYATITITINGPVIWFVDDSAAPGGTGRLSAPFQTLAEAAAVDAANQRIFLYTGTYSGGITLKSGEWLIGQGVTGASFDTLFGIAPPAGTIARPSINGTRPTTGGPIAMAGSSAVRGLNIAPASGTQGLTASGATGLTVGEVSVTTSSAAAVNLTNSDGTFSFTSISANGGANGIAWNNASPASGSLTVAGTGGVCTFATQTCTGGVIQVTTGDGVFLSNAANVSLSLMKVHNNAGNGVKASAVSGLSLLNSIFVANSDDIATNDEANLRMLNMSGTITITNAVFRDAVVNNVYWTPSSGTATLIASGSTFGPNSALTGGSGLLLAASGTANITMGISGGSFAGNRGDSLRPAFVDNSTGNVTVSGGTSFTDSNSGVNFSVDSNADLTFNVSGSTFLRHLSHALQMIVNDTATASSSVRGTAANNTIGDSTADSGSRDANGISFDLEGAGEIVLAVIGNTIQHTDSQGIFIQSRRPISSAVAGPNVHLTLRDNSVSNIDDNSAFPFLDVYGTFLRARNVSNLCLDMANNASAHKGTFTDFFLQQSNTATFRLERFVGNGASTTDVNSYTVAQNPGGYTASSIIATTFTGVADGTCQNP